MDGDTTLKVLMDQIRKFRNRYWLAKHFDEMAKQLRAKNAEIESGLLSLMADAGIHKVSLKNGGGTLTPKKTIWAKALVEDQAAIVKALKEADMPEMILNERMNHQKLSAYLRELDNLGKPIPEKLKDYIGTSEVESLRPTK